MVTWIVEGVCGKMNSIYVTMLGRFDILVEGDSALVYLNNSSKSILLLKYFLLNQNKPIAVTDLIANFWAEPDKSTNPESALKTMISRIRSSLAKASPQLKNCILSEKKSYMWNPAIACTVDAFQFEALYRELQEEIDFNEDVRGKYIQVLNLYGGDLAYSSIDEDWIVSRSMYLHHLYLRTVYRFIEMLKAEEDYEMVIHVCRIALDIDTFDETLNLELMSALKQGGQNSAALMQYRHITSAYYKYLGIEPSDKILGFYRSLIKSDLAHEADINSIRQDLTAPEEKADEGYGGAFVCDYSIFKDIYQLQMRNLERQKNKMFLTLASVIQTMDDPLPPLVLDGVMRGLLDVLKRCLRKGDTIARYSPSQYAILLPMVNYASGQIVINRIKKLFYKKYTDSNVTLSFQIGSMDID